MLQSIRDRTQGWIAGIIISILILTFALWGIHSYIASVGTNPNVAKVNGVEITKPQLAAAYERLRRQQQLQYNASLTEANLKNQALQSLINITILQQASLNEGYRISARQINNFLTGMSEFQVNGQFSATRFQQVLNSSLLSTADFYDLIKTTLLIDQPRLGLIFTSFALPNEVAESSGLVEQERNLFYISIPLQYYAKESFTIPDALIQAYYQKHLNDFKTKEQVSIEYLELSINGLMTKLQPSESELQQYYNENNNLFMESPRWKLESIQVPFNPNATPEAIQQAQNKIKMIYQKAQTGIDFAKLARDYGITNNKDNAQNWVALNQLPKEIQNEIVHSTKVGDITSPIQTKQGFIIYKIKDYAVGTVLSFEKAKTAVKDAYTRQKAEEQFANLRETLANLTYEHPDSLAEAAKELGLTIQETNLFSKDDTTAVDDKLRAAAFNNEVLNLQNNSDLIQKSSDTVAVIRIKQHVPATVLTLNAVKNQIIQKLTAQEINAKTLALASNIKIELQKNRNGQQLANQYHLTLTNLGFIGRHSSKVDSSILNTAFAMPIPQSAQQMTYAIAKTPEGYAIIGLKSLKKGSLTNTDQYRVFAEQIQNTQGLLEYGLYKQSLINNAKVKVYN